jgi:hypothetical protein
MTAADDAATLTAFRKMLDEYEALCSLRDTQHWSGEDGQRIDHLETGMGVQLERVRALVDHAISPESLEDKWNDGGFIPWYVALFRVPQLTREIKRLINRAIGVYQDGGPAPGPPPPVSLPSLAFVTDSELRKVLERNAIELGHAMASTSWTSAIVLAGAIAEGVLYFLLSQRQTDARAAAAIVSARPGKPPITGAIEKWKLWAYIDVADEMKVLKATTSAIAHGVLRDFRNMVHPWVQIRDGLEPTPTAAQGSVLYLGALIKDVVAALPPPPAPPAPTTTT